MAVTIDARTDGGKTSGATSLAWNHTVGASLTNGILIGHGTTGSATLKDISTFQWDAAGTPVALTKKGSANDTSNNCYAQTWHLVNPASGTKQVKITPTASCEITGGSASYSLVNQSTPWNAASAQTATGTASGGTPQPSVTVTSAVNEMAVVCCVENGGSTLVVGSGQTTVHLDNIGASQHAGASSDEAGAATVVMDYTGAANGNPWAIVGGSLQFDGGGGAAVSTRPAYLQSVPMRPGPGGLNTRTAVWAQATSNALSAPPPLITADVPRPFQMTIPMRPTAGGFVIGRVWEQSRGTPVPPPSGTRRRIRLIT